MRSQNAASPSPDELHAAALRMEERTCRVGGPRGPIGIVERVYLGRKSTVMMCKVVMESGAVRYVDSADVYCY